MMTDWPEAAAVTSAADMASPCTQTTPEVRLMGGRSSGLRLRARRRHPLASNSLATSLPMPPVAPRTRAVRPLVTRNSSADRINGAELENPGRAAVPARAHVTGVLPGSSQACTRATHARQNIRLQMGLLRDVTVRHLRGFTGYGAQPNAAKVMASVNCGREERI